MKILITGSTGQLGKTLIEEFNNIPTKKQIKIYSPSRKEFNLSSKSHEIVSFIDKLNPDWVINCAAYTEVDKAEEEPELAYKINCVGPKSISEALQRNNGKMIHISTDYVFSGGKGTPYKPYDKLDPISIYGKTKAEGENCVISNLKERSHIVRVSWLYSSYRKNFLLTMLKLHQIKGRNKETLNIVYDQISCPTSTSSLSKFIWKIISSDNILTPQIMHWSDTGVCSWYDFAFEIGNLAFEKGIIKNKALLYPIKSSQYPTKAKRPNFSLLDCSESWKLFDEQIFHWKIALTKVLENSKRLNID